MHVIGLTGGIGSGKSTVAELFAQHGVPVIDTDLIAHALTRGPSPAMTQIAHTFGPEFIAPDGSLRRDVMRAHVFRQPDARQRLEHILHPAIHDAASAALAHLPAHTAYALLVVPLLYETGDYDDLVDRVLVIDCDEATQMARVLLRPGLSREIAQAIMAQQWPRQRRLAAADDVLNNEGNLHTLALQISTLNQRYLRWDY
ncbi:dephospho-CoA kinase [Andreprevotia lacus DSM 23236]|jgi:dephospho-CoA kinase|uniref:Dephospho-CoA kinase n=1 Tax=Andreprevotia lacus DSM 23236 TaxID=1121001 RepID=A0A1W1WVY2_9NEIS|nr:dephospho-CoA kinase [Andreprevotia lacus]SMC15886.1 dephospho-CoA kinase [Andreprevotia lacus DSM 23236]